MTSSQQKLQQRVPDIFEELRSDHTGDESLRYSFTGATGVVDTLEISPELFLERGAVLLAAAPINELGFQGSVKVETFRRMDAEGLLEKIPALRIRAHDNSGDEIIRILCARPRPNLLSLNIEYSGVTQEGVEHLIHARTNLPSLVSLGLNGNPFDPCEKVFNDWGGPADWEMPPEGKALEETYGFISFLHEMSPEGRTISWRDSLCEQNAEDMPSLNL